MPAKKKKLRTKSSLRSIPIHVYAKDIKLGKKADVCKCPVARAARRSLKKNLLVIVDGESIQIEPRDNPDNYVFSKTLLKEVQDWIKKFDAHGRKGLEPISFSIKVPKEFMA